MKNYYPFLVCLIFASFLVNGCSSGNKEYYRLLKLGSKCEIIGYYPVDDDSADIVNCYRVKTDNNNKIVEVEYIEYGKANIDSYFGALIIVIDYSGGYETRIYQNPGGKPMENSEGVYSNCLSWDEKSNSFLVSNHDVDGSIMLNVNGVAEYINKLDEKDQIIQSLSADKNGTPISDKKGVSEKRMKYDNQKNEIEEKYFGLDGNPVSRRDLGVGTVKASYDREGNIEEERYYDTAGQLKERSDLGVALIHFKYNERGEPTEIKFFGVDGKLKNCEGGIKLSSIFMHRDELKFFSEPASHCILRQLGPQILSGNALISLNYDERGHMSEISFYDCSEQLTNNVFLRAAIIQFQYDRHGLPKKVTFLDKDRKVIMEKNKYDFHFF